MQQPVGDPVIAISLPLANETLGLQFSVFGTCSDIQTNNPTLTVQVMNGQTQVASATAVNNQQNGTYEAAFDLTSSNPNIQGTGSVVVSCSDNAQASNGGLTISNQPSLTITSPSPGGPEQAAGFPSWSSGVVARGQVAAAYAGKFLWLRLTDAGKDITTHYSWVIDNSGSWECDLSQLVANARHSGSKSKHYNVHVSVWDTYLSGERVRVASGFFSVGT